MIKRSEKFRLNFSSSLFVIRVNHPCSFTVYYHLFGVFRLSKLLFSGFLYFNGKFLRDSF